MDIRFYLNNVPYQYPCAGMTTVEVETYLSVAITFRVKSAVLKVSNIVPITDE